MARNVRRSIDRDRIQILIEKLAHLGERFVELNLLRGGNARIWHRPIRNKPPKKKPLGKSQRLRSGKKQLLRLFDFFLSLDLCFFHKLTSLICSSQARFSAKTGLAKSWTLIARRRGTKSWILPRLTTDNLSSDRFYLRNVKRNRPELATVH